MPPVSKSFMPNTWIRRVPNANVYRCNSEGNSSSYSSAEDSQQNAKQCIPSFMMNDDLNKRSYVDPWDMENYSFLRKQLEDFNISDNELSPAFESTQSDFYYVPLDNNGSPQYQYKHYIDAGIYNESFSPLSTKDDVHGLMANIDEYDFYNEHLDKHLGMMKNEEFYMEFNNPSRQSERSRYNNQDYQTYTPPSIIKDIPNFYVPSPVCKLQRRASAVTFRPNLYADDFINTDNSRSFHLKSNLKNLEMWQPGKKSLTDIKLKLNRRKSFHDVSNSDLKLSKQERRKSVSGNPQLNKWKTLPTEVIPEHRTKDYLEKRRSVVEASTELTKLPQKILKEGILQSSENRGSRVGLNVSFNNEINFDKKPGKPIFNSQPNNSLIYVYETARRRRKMFLPNTVSKIFKEENFRYNGPEIQDVFSLDPIEQYLNRPTSRFTMTNYGHLKIDYSCSWNYLDKCIAQRVCM